MVQAGEPGCCQINGHSIITNLSSEQLAREAGIAEPAAKQPRQNPPVRHQPAPPEEIQPYQAASLMSRYELTL